MCIMSSCPTEKTTQMDKWIFLSMVQELQTVIDFLLDYKLHVIISNYFSLNLSIVVKLVSSSLCAIVLQQLYLATGNPLTYEEDDRPVVVGEQLCVVCQFFPLSRALLPCRHTCVCASCFAKLESCPMCRSPINSYFCIRSEEYLPESDVHAAPSKPEPISQWIQDRLTDFLGFHR